MIPNRRLWIAALVLRACLSAQAPVVHLEPIPAYSIFIGDGDSYRKRLINNDSPVLFMLVEPSFSEPYSIVLSEESNQAKGTVHFILEHSVQSRTKASLPPIKRSMVEIPADLAMKIEQAWELVLRGTRYPPKPDESKQTYERMDGDTFEFFLKPDLFGQTWSPTVVPPRALVDLGSEIIRLVHASPGAKDQTLRQCHAMAAAILQLHGPESPSPKVPASRSSLSPNSDRACIASQSSLSSHNLSVVWRLAVLSFWPCRTSERCHVMEIGAEFTCRGAFETAKQIKPVMNGHGAGASPFITG